MPSSEEKGERKRDTDESENRRAAVQARSPHETSEPGRGHAMDQRPYVIVEGERFSRPDLSSEPGDQHESRRRGEQTEDDRRA